MTSRIEARPPVAVQPHAEAADGAATDVAVLVAANVLVAVGLWLRDGGLHTSSGPGGVLTGVGQLTGLLATDAVLVELLLMSRMPILERRLGFDGLARWHRWNGFASTWLIVLHVVAVTLGYAEAGRVGLPHQFGDFIRHYPDVLMATVGTVLLIAVAVTSVRAARARLRRESWYVVHLYAYLAVALTFAHQLAVGSDFVDDRLARIWWVALYVVVGGSILVWRVGWPLWFNARHQLRVADVVAEGPGVVSVYVTGRDLDRVPAEAGQFFLWRILTRDLWSQAHPFSLSAAPHGRSLRITVKDLGDFTRALAHVRPGTRVFAEGPYGTFTARRQTRPRALLIAGGIGITPLRALLETIPAGPGDLTLVYRVQRSEDFVFRDEIDRLVQKRGIVLYPIAGTDIGDDQTDRLGIPALQRLVPDVADRDIYLCGPPALLDALHRRLRHLGVPRHQIHSERFTY
ncbi:MAG TPA: ferredoxin reductase family protein [Acidimicrobiales bacterium]|nr:ferredoxin reductase family protein [Acidimicrobiales bacterium]